MPFPYLLRCGLLFVPTYFPYSPAAPSIMTVSVSSLSPSPYSSSSLAADILSLVCVEARSVFVLS